MVVKSAVILAILAGFVSTASAEVWTGPTMTFAKAGSEDPALPENQDQLTPNVAITRQLSGGPFNAVTESTFNRDISPSEDGRPPDAQPGSDPLWTVPAHSTSSRTGTFLPWPRRSLH